MEAIKLLYVEDNPGDVLLLTEALDETGIDYQLIHINNGKHALDYFLSIEETVKPDLIFLDINIPLKSGLEILAHLKQIKRIPEAPVVILTSSSHEKDRSIAKRLGVAEFLCKPLHENELFQLFTRIFPVMKTA